MGHPKLLSVTLLGSALALAVLAPTEFAQARPTSPPPGITAPIAPTDPIAPRPSSSGVAQNSGAFVTTTKAPTSPTVQTNLLIKPAKLGSTDL